MIDDLVKRLQDAATEALQSAWSRTDGGQDLCLGANLAEEAADRIAALEAELATALKLIATLEAEQARAAALAEKLAMVKDAWAALRHIAVTNSNDADEWDQFIAGMDAALEDKTDE